MRAAENLGRFTPTDPTELAAGILAALPPVTLTVVYEPIAMERRRAAHHTRSHQPQPVPAAPFNLAGAHQEQALPTAAVRTSTATGQHPAPTRSGRSGSTARARAALAHHLAQGGDTDRPGLAATLAATLVDAVRCSLRTAQRVIAEHRKAHPQTHPSLSLRAVRAPAGGADRPDRP